MIDVLTAEDVRRQDEAAAAAGTPVARLMENAGAAVARAARAMLGGAYGRRVVIVCGKGNNGGDGLVAGRMLAARGAHVTAVLAGDVGGLAVEQRDRFPGRISAHLRRELARADLAIDALFGVGLTRAPEGAYADAIEALNAAAVPVLSVDVPSGMIADTGVAPGAVVRATRTIALSGYKPGLLFAPALAGDVEVADIGAASGGAIHALEASDVAALLPVRAGSIHKRAVGAVLVVAGSRAMPGAAALVAGASVHAGAGLTVLCATEDVCRVVLARHPEMTTIPLPESGEGTIDPKALDLIRPRLDEFRALAVGPGLSTHPATVEFARALLAEAEVPVVLDADGLNALAGEPEALRARRAPTVLTPHGGELARLTGSDAATLAAGRLKAARDAASSLGATVVFKGPGTVIDDGRATFVNATGGPALAQGGTGDVLAGVLAALVAQRGAAPADLIAAGVWLHGRAGDRVAARLAPHPANASALVEELGPTIHEVAG